MQGQKHFLVHLRLLLWHDGLVEVTGLTLNLLCSANFIFQTVTFAFSFVHCVDDSVVCFRIHTGGELLRADSLTGDALLKQLWHHSDAIMCCSLKTNVIHLTNHFMIIFRDKNMGYSILC